MKQSSIDFENIVLNELSRAWHRNVRQFKWSDSGIVVPIFKITDANVSYWGLWSPSTREMSFSRHMITSRPWNEVLEVVKHEMAHQYVSEVLKQDAEAPHGPTFLSVCKQYQIDGAARAIPGADKVSTTNHIVEKIRHLLELSTNSGATEQEAKTAAELAHNLMLKYNIALQDKNEEQGYTIGYLGGIHGRIQKYMSRLASILSKHYFVEVIWISSHDPRTNKSGQELEVSGTKENVEVAEYIFNFISNAAIETWNKKIVDGNFILQLQREHSNNYGYGRPESMRGFTISARSNFLEGFVLGFESQLKLAAVKEKEEGLILVKDPNLEAFYHTRHPHIRNKATGSGHYNGNMQRAGFAEGKSINVPSAMGSNKKFIPLLGK